MGATGLWPSVLLANLPNGEILSADSKGTVYGSTSAYLFTVPTTGNGSESITPIAYFNGTNGNGANALFFDSQGDIYGTSPHGGAYGNGCVFEITAGSSVITDIADFNGASPVGRVTVDSQGNVFGLTSGWGGSFSGYVFEVVSGSGKVTDLADFDPQEDDHVAWNDGRNVVLDNHGNLFGTTPMGGANNLGTVFEVVAGSHKITILASFNGLNGATPVGGIVLDGNGNLFGSAYAGGATYGDYDNNGTGAGDIFEVVAGSGAITDLWDFDYISGYAPTGLVSDGKGDLFGFAHVMLFELTPSSKAAGAHRTALPSRAPAPLPRRPLPAQRRR